MVKFGESFGRIRMNRQCQNTNHTRMAERQDKQWCTEISVETLKWGKPREQIFTIDNGYSKHREDYNTLPSGSATQGSSHQLLLT